ncbi:hypothetical protein ACVWXU_002365 [Streptomyces sp. TE33382]
MSRVRELARRAPAVDPDMLGDRTMLINDGLAVRGSTLGPTAAATMRCHVRPIISDGD